MSAQLRGGADNSPVPAVPYIATWSAEERNAGQLTLRPDGCGIAYLDETPHDRDREGALWLRTGLARGRGRPAFGVVHPARQRRAMRLMLCQVCAGPADRDERGVLWLLGDDHDDWPGWPEEMGAPIRRCAAPARSPRSACARTCGAPTPPSASPGPGPAACTACSTLPRRSPATSAPNP